MRDIFDLIGRIFLSAIFFFEAFDSVKSMSKTKTLMTEYGINSNQDLWIYGAVFLLLLGGTLLLIGYRSTFGALLLLCYWIPVTFLVYDFWNAPKADLRIESIIFMKNMAIVGGLLMVIANGSGKYSIKRLLATTRVR